MAIVENREDAVYIQVIYKLHREVFGVLACPNHEALDDLDPPSRISKLTTWRAQVVNFRLGLGGPKFVCQTGPKIGHQRKADYSSAYYVPENSRFTLVSPNFALIPRPMAPSIVCHHMIQDV